MAPSFYSGQHRSTRSGRQVALIAKLSSTYRNSIRLLRERLVGRPETDGFNCHTYTFGLRGVVRRFAIMGVRPYRAFVTWVIANVLTEIEWSDCRDGDFVVYFGGQSVEHSGVWDRGRVRSKWGTAHLWEHAVHEVPLRYGDRVRIYRGLPPERCVAAFEEFARALRSG